MSQHAFYLARAAEAKEAAYAAKLANVRERCLRAEAAWIAMAVRAERLDTARDKARDEKAAALLRNEEAGAQDKY